MPALVKAIKEKRFKQVRLLVASGYNINDKELESGHTALIASCLLEDEQKACCIIKWLLSHEACLSTPDNGGLTPMIHACGNRKHRIVELLLKEKDLDLKAQDNEGNTALLYAIKTGDLRITKLILREFESRKVQGQDQANNAGETPLITAAKLGFWECCNALLEGGKASPHARDFVTKLTAEEWMLTLNANALSSRKNSMEKLPKQNVKTRQVRSGKGTWCSLELESSGKQVVNVNGGDQKTTAKRRGFQPLAHTKSNHFHISRRSGTDKHVKRSEKLLEGRRGRVIKIAHKDGGHEEPDFKARNSATSTLVEVRDFGMRGHTSQDLTSNFVVEGHNSQRFVNSRGNDRSMSAPQRAYVNHVNRLRKSYDKQRENTPERNGVLAWSQPKRSKSILHHQLPSLFRVLEDQHSSSYRIKATPPAPVPAPAPQPLTNDTNPRRKDVLKRFAKAGFASLVMSKLTVGRRTGGATERNGKLSPLFGSTRGRTRSSSCRSDGSSRSANSQDFSALGRGNETIDYYPRAHAALNLSFNTSSIFFLFNFSMENTVFVVLYSYT